jgi:hypothetical protein
MATTRRDLLQLAAELRLALPHQAPLQVAELVQHCVVRLELLARTDSDEETRLHHRQHALQLMQLCREYVSERRPFRGDG